MSKRKKGNLNYYMYKKNFSELQKWILASLFICLTAICVLSLLAIRQIKIMERNNIIAKKQNLFYIPDSISRLKYIDEEYAEILTYVMAENNKKIITEELFSYMKKRGWEWLSEDIQNPGKGTALAEEWVEYYDKRGVKAEGWYGNWVKKDGSVMLVYLSSEPTHDINSLSKQNSVIKATYFYYGPGNATKIFPNLQLFDGK